MSHRQPFSLNYDYCLVLTSCLTVANFWYAFYADDWTYAHVLISVAFSIILAKYMCLYAANRVGLFYFLEKRSHHRMQVIHTMVCMCQFGTKYSFLSKMRLVRTMDLWIIDLILRALLKTPFARLISYSG